MRVAGRRSARQPRHRPTTDSATDDRGRSPTSRARHDRARFDMSKNSDKERGEKRGVLSTGRANDSEDADDAANEED